MSKEVRPEAADIIKQSNRITSAMYDFSPLEAKGLLLAYSKFTEHDKVFQEYVFSITDVAKAISKDDSADKVWDALERLQGKVIKVKGDDGEWIGYSPLPTIKLHPAKRTVIFKLNPDLQPFFLELRREFTVFPADHAFRLQGKYSLRLFQLVMQWRAKAEANHGVFVVALKYADLREMFMIKPDEYLLASKFRIQILERAMTEINAADVGLMLTLEPPTKNGKTITHFNVKMRLIEPGSPRAVVPPTKRELTDDEYIAKHQDAFDYWLNFAKHQPEFEAMNNQRDTPFMRENRFRVEALKLCKEHKGKKGNS